MTRQISKHKAAKPENILNQTLQLPCGATLKNRIAKAAMSDSLGDGKGNPTETQIRLYERWAQAETALSIIGEMQTDPRYPEKPGNLVLTKNNNQKALQALTKRATINNAHLWPQLGHAGALAHLPISKPKGPSPLNIKGLQCTAMSIKDIQELPEIYATAAKLAKNLKFTGIQIHAAHGFLLSQFLSPLFNHRTDKYGGTIKARFRIINEIIYAIRQTVGNSFPIAIKINSTDKLQGGLTEQEATEIIRLLNNTSIDLIDISGGTYFPGAKASSDSAPQNQPYFIAFAQHAKTITKIPIMATGGFKTQAQAINAVKNGAADIVGIARAMALNPQLAKTWLHNKGDDPEFPTFKTSPKGGITAWYTMRLTALGKEEESEFSLDPHSALKIYEKRDAQRCIPWREKFSQTPNKS